MFSVILLILFIPSLIFYFNLKLIKQGSDHYYHTLIIDLILKHKRKFVFTHDNIINENIVSYPQLMHWILSFFSKEFIEKISSKLIIIFSLLSSICFFIFLNIISTYVKLFEDDYYVVLASLVFYLIPYNYHSGNAKNTGASARGLGLLLGQVLLYFLVLYKLSDNYIYLWFSVIPCFLSFISSQFATQYVIFYLTILSISFLDIYFILVLLSSFALFLLTMPKVALNYFKGQYGHKKLYSQYLASVYILKNRPSIWGDIFVFLPKQIYYFIKRDILKIKYKLRDYLNNNSLIILIFQIPLILVVMIDGYNNSFQYSGYEKILMTFLLALFLIFLVITFRPFRFLGEPERYLEFGFGILAILSLLVLPNNLIFVNIGFCIIYLIADYFLRLKNNRANEVIKIDSNFNSFINDAKNLLLKDKDAILLSDSVELTKFFLDVRLKIYFFVVNLEKSDEFHFKDLYKTVYAYISPDVMIRLIKHYKVTYLVIDNINWKTYHEDLFSNDINYSVSIDANKYKLLKLTTN